MRKFVALTASLAVVIFAGGMVGGSLRYGSPDGLYRRVHAELVARQPHPLYAPTPLPVSTAGLPVAEPAPASTATPTVKPTSAAKRPVSTSARTQPVAPISPPASATPYVTPTAAAAPLPEPSSTLRETPEAASQPPSMPPNVRLSGLTHMWQTWNNCGPATLAMNLSYFGSDTTQAQAAAGIRPNKEDKNVSPEELAAFARSQGLEAIARVNGTSDDLRGLLANGIPVLVETWHEPKPNDGMGHYRLLTGYDDAEQAWIAYDSYDATGIDRNESYAGIRISYGELDPLWMVFNRQYVVIYSPELAPKVQMILGDDFDDEAMWQRALADAESAVAQEPASAFAWFNLGSDLTAVGRFEEAAKAYDRARQIGLPWRMFWYQFGPFEAYHQVGRYDEVIALADATIRTAKYVEELYYWRGLAQQAQGNMPAARASFQRSLEMNRNYVPAAEALAALPPP